MILTRSFNSRLTLALAGVIVATAAPIQAGLITFNSTGAIVNWTAPATGIYDITAYGAQGGNEEYVVYGIAPGGLGGYATGNFSLATGQVLQIAVGAQGGTGINAAGGGGGSFVVDQLSGDPLLVAGGGGGGIPGVDGGPGGETLVGTGGGTGVSGFGGGGGFIGDGEGGVYGGASFIDGLAGGAAFSYGSNGGGGGDGGAGGGGGGYAGGDSANPGLGGSSYDTGLDRVQSPGVETGNGLITIQTVPEPATFLLSGLGLVGCGVVARRKKHRRA